MHTRTIGNFPICPSTPGCKSHTLPIPKNLIGYINNNNKTNFGILRFEQLPGETCQLNILY